MLSKRLLHLGYTIQVKSVIAGIVYVAQRRVFHFGHKEIYISKAIHVAVVVVVVVFFFACWSRQQNFSYDNFPGQFALAKS